MTIDSDDSHTVNALLDDYIAAIRVELQARWRAWQLDLTKSYVHEVVGGLMARHVTLATQLAKAPQIWNGHIAPLLLRSMIDAYITLAWIFESPEDRSDQYIKFGLGQRKLWLEHFKASLVEKGVTAIDDHPIVKAVTAKLNSERFEHLTEVSVGSWSEKSTREMAAEADCLSLYRLGYTPFSGAVHSMWHHVADYNLERCGSPLHQYHRIPVDPERESDFDYVYRAAKYVAKAFELFDRKTGVRVDVPSGLDSLLNAVDELSSPLEDDTVPGQG